MLGHIFRRALPAAAGALLGLAVACAAWAQPEPVRIIVPAPAGGSLDASARIVAQRLAAVTGEPHVVENKPGANTLIGSEYVAHAPADGRTLLFAGLSIVINPLLQTSAARTLQDLRPVIALSRERYGLIGASALKLSSARELGRLVAARQGGVNCAAPPGVMLLACEQLRGMYPNMNVIPYPGIAPALQAVAGGHVDLLFVPEETAARVVQGGQAVLIGVHGAATSAAGVPGLNAVWPDLQIESVQGMLVPAGTPDARVRQLNAQFARVLAEPQTRERMRAAGHEPLQPGPPEDYSRMLAELARRYGLVIDRLGLAR